jgi:hypothetical protein
MEDNPYLIPKPKVKRNKHKNKKERNVSPLRVDRETIINKVYHPILSTITPMRYRNHSPASHPISSVTRLRSLEASDNKPSVNCSFLIGSSGHYSESKPTPSLDSSTLKEVYANILPDIKQKKGKFKFKKRNKKVLEDNM